MKLGQGSTRRVHAIGLALVVAAIAATPARASTPALAGGCDEQQAFIEGDAAAVAERLPQRYTPVKAADGSPLLFARAIRCDSLAADGASGPAVMASYGVLIESPDGLGCGSAAPGVGATRGDQPPICNWYVLSWMADSPRVARWLRAGTPEFPARYVPGLRFQLGNVDPTGGKPFHFEAPDPAPSPFVIDSVGHERPGALSVRGGYWADSPGGTVKVAFSTDDLISGDASGTVTARPGSELSRLIGDHDGSYAPGFSDFSAERWEHASYRKQNLAPSARADSFEGSCSVQGDVSFSPPATNTEGPLRYDYTGSGTCSGTLDGRDVTDAPVELHQSGRSQASCSKHVTSEPGTGTMTFASGETLRFTLDFSGAGTEDDFTFYGDRSGFARGHGTFTTQRTPPDLALQCAGSGVTKTAYDVTVTTESPLVSDRPAAPRLRLAVSPRKVRAGTRTRFRFRTAAGARIAFAGRRVRAGSHGRASIVACLGRPGRHRAMATKPGFRAGRAVVRVRRR